MTSAFASSPVANTPAPDLPDHLPHDIYELVPYHKISLLSLLLLGFAILLLLWFLQKLLRKWWASHRKSPAQDPLEDHLKALGRLVPPQPFGERRQSADYFFALSWHFRELLEIITPIRATDLTLGELKPHITTHFAQSSHPTAEDLLSFLSRSDMIKFSDATTNLTEATECHQQVLTWAQNLVSIHREKLKELAQKKELP